MTIICYKDGILAANTSVRSGGIHSGNVSKIIRGPDGSVGSATGAMSTCHFFRECIETGEHEKFSTNSDEFIGLLIRPPKVGEKEPAILKVDNFGWYPAPRGSHVAMGCAEDVARGAMWAGAGAIEAVKICNEYCDGCGGDVDWVMVGDGSPSLTLVDTADNAA